MKKHLVISLIAGSMMTLTASAAVATATATTPAATPLAAPAVHQITQMSVVLQNLQTSGYVAVQKIKLDDGFYKAEVINVQGEKVNVRIDPETGSVVDPKPSQPAINILTAVNKIEAAGYHGIYKIESNGDKYDVKALDQNGKDVHLTVDVVTGKVSKKWFG